MVPLWRNAFPSTSGLVWDWRKVKNLDSWLLRLLEDDEKFNEELKHHTESHVLQFLLGSNQNSNLEFGRFVVDVGPFKASFQRMPTLGNCAFVTQFLEALLFVIRVSWNELYGLYIWRRPLDTYSSPFAPWSLVTQLLRFGIRSDHCTDSSQERRPFTADLPQLLSFDNNT